MVKRLASGVLLVTCGIGLGIAIDRGMIPAVSAQQREGTPRPGAAADAGSAAAGSGDADGARPDELDHHDGRPVALDQSVVGRQEEELAARAVLLQRVARPHPAARCGRIPTIRNPGRPEGRRICRASSTASTRAAWPMVKDGDREEGRRGFAKNYRTMLESCYACHKSVGRPYIRPQIPTAQVQAMVNMDPAATWPQ